MLSIDAFTHFLFRLLERVARVGRFPAADDEEEGADAELRLCCLEEERMDLPDVGVAD